MSNPENYTPDTNDLNTEEFRLEDVVHLLKVANDELEKATGTADTLVEINEHVEAGRIDTGGITPDRVEQWRENMPWKYSGGVKEITALAHDGKGAVRCWLKPITEYDEEYELAQGQSDLQRGKIALRRDLGLFLGGSEEFLHAAPLQRLIGVKVFEMMQTPLALIKKA